MNSLSVTKVASVKGRRALLDALPSSVRPKNANSVSALWEVQEIAGIFVGNDPTSGDNAWVVWAMGPDDCCAETVAIVQKLKGQRFSSRKEALQALHAAALSS